MIQGSRSLPVHHLTIRVPWHGNGWQGKDKKTWIQEGTNQRVILDTFFGAAKPDESLVLFYAKRMPLTDDARRFSATIATQQIELKETQN